jgi:AraC family transcriptional regulator
MQHRIETIGKKLFLGKRMTMSFPDHKTVELWKSFMPRRKEIQNNIGSELYSIEVYNPLFFQPMSELSQPMLELSPTFSFRHIPR